MPLRQQPVRDFSGHLEPDPLAIEAGEQLAVHVVGWKNEHLPFHHARQIEQQFIQDRPETGIPSKRISGMRWVLR